MTLIQHNRDQYTPLRIAMQATIGICTILYCYDNANSNFTFKFFLAIISGIGLCVFALSAWIARSLPYLIIGDEYFVKLGVVSTFARWQDIEKIDESKSQTVALCSRRGKKINISYDCVQDITPQDLRNLLLERVRACNS